MKHRIGHRWARRLRHEHGFTLIELLVVMIIIGILTAIVLPSFIAQSRKADDAQAKSLARNAATAMETYDTDHSSYTGATPSSLNSIESTLNVTSNTSSPYVAAVSVTASTYTITVSQPVTTDVFTVTFDGSNMARSCTGSGGGCTSGTW